MAAMGFVAPEGREDAQEQHQGVGAAATVEPLPGGAGSGGLLGLLPDGVMGLIWENLEGDSWDQQALRQSCKAVRNSAEIRAKISRLKVYVRHGQLQAIKVAAFARVGCLRSLQLINRSGCDSCAVGPFISAALQASGDPAVFRGLRALELQDVPACWEEMCAALSHHCPQLESLRVVLPCSPILAQDLRALSSLRSLHLAGVNLHKQASPLAGISCLPSLEHLSLDGGCWGSPNPGAARSLDLSPVSQLPDLQSLAASGMPVQGLQGVVGCTGLTRLVLSKAHVPAPSHLQPLRHLRCLQSLTVELRDPELQRAVHAVAAVTTLTHLSLRPGRPGDGLAIVDVQPLSALTGLRDLQLAVGGHGMMGLGAVTSSCTQLTSTELQIGKGNPSHAAAISSLMGLQSLVLTMNFEGADAGAAAQGAVCDVAALPSLTQLALQFCFRSTAALDVQPLSALTRLRDLKLTSRGPTLAGLDAVASSCTQLTCLEAMTLGLGFNTRALHSLASLQSLSLVLEHSTAMQGLQAAVCDVAALTSLAHLKVSRASSSATEGGSGGELDVSPLSRLSLLRSLEVGCGDDGIHGEWANWVRGLVALGAACPRLAALEVSAYGLAGAAGPSSPSSQGVAHAGGSSGGSGSSSSSSGGAEGSGAGAGQDGGPMWASLRTASLPENNEPGHVAALQLHCAPRLAYAALGFSQLAFTLEPGPASSPEALQAACKSLASCRCFQGSGSSEAVVLHWHRGAGEPLAPHLAALQPLGPHVERFDLYTGRVVQDAEPLRVQVADVRALGGALPGLTCLGFMHPGCIADDAVSEVLLQWPRLEYLQLSAREEGGAPALMSFCKLAIEQRQVAQAGAEGAPVGAGVQGHARPLRITLECEWTLRELNEVAAAVRQLQEGGALWVELRAGNNLCAHEVDGGAESGAGTGAGAGAGAAAGQAGAGAGASAGGGAAAGAAEGEGAVRRAAAWVQGMGGWTWALPALACVALALARALDRRA